MPAPTSATILGGGVVLRRVAMVETLLGGEGLEDILNELGSSQLRISGM